MRIIAPVIALLVLVGVFSYFDSLSHTVREGLFFVATPMLETERYFKEGMSNVGAIFKEKQQLLLENRDLKEQITTYEARLLPLNFLVEENRLLKEKLGRSQTSKDSMLAVVLSKPNRTVYDTLIVDVGMEEGVREGDTVAAYDDLIIGIVGEVMRHSSIVKLFSSPGEEIDVTLGDESTTAVARGVGGGNFEVELPRGVDISPGDVVSFPSISKEVAGVVEKIKVRPADAYQTILFKSPVNLFMLRFVEVFKSSESR